ncbi:DUF2336 domain-containing protein [uncultured Devosia sp.]|uniref:DUF2336 domain-containing protein n=1 Tax=uncultured Devosia sp. TaxID=211434 RepID=UPI002609083D|nr:DUF2336 domain-containing protein [uncultured Devosia sp.]
MTGYEAFAELSQSRDSDERGHAAHLAAMAYLDHSGPADEHAALYAALIGFLDDSSVKVRAALAYGLLHSERAPRPVILALLQDSAIISRAVLQYSPILIDADLLPIIVKGDIAALTAISQRRKVSARLAAALIASGDHDLIIRVLERQDLKIDGSVLAELARSRGTDGRLRGALLARKELPGTARLMLVQQITESLKTCRMVKGALTAERLGRILRDGTDTAVAIIGEAEATDAREQFVETLVDTDQVSARLLLHAIATGRVMFFASCIAGLSSTSASKVFTLLEAGSATTLQALFSRCGLSSNVSGLLVRIVLHARTADLADDVAARHYVLTALTEELINEYDGNIPAELEEAFCYLNEQNISLARKAARGVMAAFDRTTHAQLPVPREQQQLVLPAA